MTEWRRWLPRLLVESVVVVFSILLALAVDEWRRGEATEERVRDSLRSIRAELVDNRETVRANARYHLSLSDTLFALDNTGTEVPPEDVPSRGWILPADLVSNAWEVATSTGTAADMPHATAVALARAYQVQERYRESRHVVMGVLYRASAVRETPSVRRLYPAVAGFINDLGHREQQLLDAYDDALARLEGGRAADGARASR